MNNFSKKQSFGKIYGEFFLAAFCIAIGIPFSLILILGPGILASIYNNDLFLLIYLFYGLLGIGYYTFLLVKRFRILSRFPLTKEEKKKAKIYTAEDAFMFLWLTLHHSSDSWFTLFHNETYLKEIYEYIKSSITPEEYKFYEHRSFYSFLYFEEFLNFLHYILLVTDRIYLIPRITSDCVIHNIDWITTPFCRHNFNTATKDLWTWDMYVEERDKYCFNK